MGVCQNYCLAQQDNILPIRTYGQTAVNSERAKKKSFEPSYSKEKLFKYECLLIEIPSDSSSITDTTSQHT